VAQDPDPYAVLGVAPGSSTPTIRKAYHALARAAHPDLVGDGGLPMMQRLNAAWFILRDPVRRATYDATQPGRPLPGDKGSAAGPSRAQARARGPQEPLWTGAAGAPPGRPSGSRLDFGLYAGWTLGEIARYDTGYLAWLRDRKEGRAYVDEITALLEHLRPTGTEAGAPKRRWRGR